MKRVLVADPIAQEGLELLSSGSEVDVRLKLPESELVAIIPTYAGLLVRSETQVTENVVAAGSNLQVIGRAGVGVDNIDLEAATRHGIAVVNAPTGNTLAAAEHTFALILALARNVPQAHQSLKQGEWRRSQFQGVELRGKTLGLVGLGRVGSEVARRGQAFGMCLLGHDPFVSPEYARLLGIDLVALDELLGQSDFVSLHVPLTDPGVPLIDDSKLRIMKQGSRLINCARGGLIDEAGLLKALNEGHLAGAALDVFSQEPPQDSLLVQHDRVVVTPHLGASTIEAQKEVGREVAEQMLSVLGGQQARYTINLPYMPPELHSELAPYIPVANYVGRLAVQICEGQLTAITIRYDGEIASHDTTILKASVLTGILGAVSERRVNIINAVLLAKQRGLEVLEQNNPKSGEYTSMLSVELRTTKGVTVISGSSLRDEAHILRVNDYWIDIIPHQGYMLVTDHIDRPGMIGSVATIIGNHGINVSFMEVGRLAPKGRATMILGLDEAIPDLVVKEINRISGIRAAVIVEL